VNNFAADIRKERRPSAEVVWKRNTKRSKCSAFTTSRSGEEYASLYGVYKYSGQTEREREREREIGEANLSGYGGADGGEERVPYATRKEVRRGKRKRLPPCEDPRQEEALLCGQKQRPAAADTQLLQKLFLPGR
jgi:hypothetical protein